MKKLTIHRQGLNRDMVNQLSRRYQNSEMVFFELNSSRTDFGPIAVLRSFILHFLQELRQDAFSLLQKHDAEINYLVPSSYTWLGMRYASEMEVSVATERTRHYPADRIDRIINGSIDLLITILNQKKFNNLAIVVSGFKQSSKLNQRICAILLRRLPVDIEMHICADDKDVELFVNELQDLIIEFRNEFCPADTTEISAEHAQHELALLENYTNNNNTLQLENIYRLIHLSRVSQDIDKEINYLFFALCDFVTIGLYEESIEVGEILLDYIGKGHVHDNQMTSITYRKMFMAYASLGQVHKIELLCQEGVAVATRVNNLASWFYHISLYYSRYAKHKDYEKAELFIRKAIVQIEIEDSEPSIKVFKKSFMNNGLALIYYYQGRFEEAFGLCNECYEMLTQQTLLEEFTLHKTNLLYNTAKLLAAANRISDAKKFYKLALERDSNYSEYYNELGNMSYLEGDYQEAKEYYERAIEVSPPYPEVWYNLGNAYYYQGEVEQAVVCYKKALEYAPRHKGALEGLSDCYVDLSQFNDAANCLQNLLKIQPEAGYYANYAYALFEAGDISKAEMILGHASSLYPDHQEIRLVTEKSLAYK